MLNEIRKTNWRSVVPYLFVIVLGCWFASSVHHEQYQTAHSNGYHEDADEEWVVIGAVATGLIAIFAFWQVIESRLSSERQLRAYVFIDSEIIKNHKDEYECKFTMKNTGQTPAYAVRDSTDAWIDNVTNRQDEPEFGTETREEVCIGPDDHFASFQGLVEGADVRKEADIIDSKKAIWGAIRVSYRDTFGKQWETELLGYFALDRLYTDNDRKLETVTYRAT